MEKNRKNSANLIAREKILKALLELLKDKPISSINVMELTKAAGVSRMTFYRNYSSMEHILTDYLNDLVRCYEKEDSVALASSIIYDAKYVIHYLEFMKQNDYFVRCLMKSGMGDLLLNAITTYEKQKWDCEERNLELNCRIHLFSGGLYNVYTFWAKEGFQHDSKEIAKIVESSFLK